jgi:hypothetical protein
VSQAYLEPVNKVTFTKICGERKKMQETSEKNPGSKTLEVNK